MKIYRIPMVPGPVSVSREVLEAGQENFGSADLEKEYIDLYKATEKSLRKIMQTKNSVVIQTGEGMLALWSALKSCLLPGDKVLVLSTGLFGYGMGGMAEAIGCEVRTVGFGFDETFTDFDLIEKAIREFQPKMITMVQNETPSGIYHSEFNDSKTENLEFLQIWIIPRVNNTKPVYKSYDIRQVDMKNRFGYIVAPDGTAPGGILQDAWFALGKLEKGKKIGYHLHQKNTGVYCFVIEGEICIEGTDLSRRDGMGITETDHFQVEARSEAYVLLIEVAMI